MKLFPFRLALAGLFLCSAIRLAAAEFYVSPQGIDTGTGTREAPWKTWAYAVERVRDFKKSSPGEPVTVYFSGGIYRISEPVLLTSDDSGTAEAPVVYAALPGETPIFSGGLPLTDWKLDSGRLNPTDRQLFFLRFPQHLVGKIYTTDLKKAGISDYGDPTDMGQRPDLYSDKKLQTLARWPNQGMTHAGRAMGSTAVGPNWANFEGYHEGIFEFLNDRQARWANEPDVRLGGYWFWDWSEEYQHVKRIDPSAHMIYLEEPYHNYGYKHRLRYFGLNLLCELDAPGEWYLDRGTGLLYWYAPDGAAPGNEVVLSVMNAPFMVELNGCTNITLKGLSFAESRGSGIRIADGKHCTVADCRVERMGSHGIRIEGGWNHTVSGSLLHTLGYSGIGLTGGDRKTITPAGHLVEHTVVEDFSLFKRTYEPAVSAAGCGFTIRNNRFSNSSSSAMRIDANEVLIEYNEISNVVNESDDQGGFDCWFNPTFQGIVIRYNRWSDIIGGTHCGAAGIRLDDMISGVLVHGNLLERCGSRNFAGVQINGGKDNRVENNVFWDCPAAVSFYEFTWSQHRWDTMIARADMQKKLYEEVDIRTEPYKSRYPKLQDLHGNVMYNEIVDNLLIDCPNVNIAADERQVFKNNTRIDSEGRTPEQVCTPSVLKQYGLEPVPLDDMGPKRNPWL